MTKFKKLLAVLVCAAMVCATLPVIGFAATGECGADLTWSLSAGTLTISGTGGMYHYYGTGGSAAPWSTARSAITTLVIEEGVTTIGQYAFCDCENLTSVTFPESLTSVCAWSFAYCDGLTSVTTPDGVTTIGECAFYDCENLTSVTIPSAELIDDVAFYNCDNLTSVTLGDNVKKIGEQAFCSCENLMIINIPDSVTYIGRNAFSGTPVNDNYFDNKNGVMYIDHALIRASTKGDFTVREGTLVIGSYAFSSQAITSISIPDTVKYINDYTFSSCTSLTAISIPSSVVSIGSYTFSGCSKLTDVSLVSGGLKTIGSYAFTNCDTMLNVVIPDGVESLGEGAFKSCDALTSITIPASVTTIAANAFAEDLSMSDVYYGGTEQQWRSIETESGNSYLLTAEIHYNSRTDVAVKGVNLSKTTAALAAGGSVELKATVLPSNATNKAVAWTTSDENVATVENGVVTAVSAGTATITVTTADGSKTASCAVTVSDTTAVYTANVTVGSVAATAGGEVVVPITISDNPGIAGFNLTINYDKTLIVPVSIESKMSKGTLTSNIHQGGDMSTYDYVTAYWVNPSDVTDNGEILNVTFRVADDAPEGEIPVSVTYVDGDITNQTYDNIGFNITNGKITVSNSLLGDVCGDGEINTKDGVRLSQYIAKWDIELTDAELSAADIVKDGVVNTKDGVKLSQYLAKWDVTLDELEEEADASILEQGAIKLEVGNVDAKAGDTIAVPVSIAENSGVAGYNFQIYYDKTALTPVSIESKMPEGTLTSNIQQGGDMSAYDCVTAYWVNPSNVTYTGEAFVITFAVAADANGELPVTMKYEENDVPCDQNLNDLAVEITNGLVSVNVGPAYTVNSLTTADNQTTGNVYAEVSVTKNTSRSATDLIVIAVYNDGALVDMTYMKAAFAKGQTVIFGGKVDVPDGAEIKAFVWDSFDTMTALSDTAEL